MKTSDDAREFIRAVIDLYLALPQTPARARRADRDLAAQLHAQNISFPVVRAALLLATVRRLSRSTPLPPIRSLHYFLPVIEEVRNSFPTSSYIEYLDSKFRQLSHPTGAP
jgi:hypothetical protein